MKHVGLASLAALAVSASATFAMPAVTVIADDAAAYALVDINNGATLAPGLSFDAVNLVTSGSSSGDWRSPYDLGAAGWEMLEYFSVGPSTTTPSTLTLTGFIGNALTLLWGSLDDYNELEFFLGGVSQGGVDGSDVLAAGSTSAPAGGGASLVTISGIQFDSVKFTSDTNAFEFANVSVAAVPVPAGGLLLLGALGGLGLLRRRKPTA